MNKHSIKYNYIMNMILTISSILFPLLSFPYVSRILGPSGVGRVSFANSIITYFSMFAQLGIPTYGIRECAKVRDDKVKLSILVKEIISLNSVFCLLTYIVFICSILSIARLRQDKLLFILMSCSIIVNSMGMEWLYKGLEEYSYITKRSVVFKFLAFVGMFLLINNEQDVLQYGILTVFAGVGSNVCNWLNAKKYIKFKNVHIVSVKRHMKPIAVFFLMSIATTIYTNLDNVMLGFMSSDATVGLYTAATKIKAALVSVVASLGTVLLPRASYYIKNNDRDSFINISHKSMGFTLLIAIPLITYFSEFAYTWVILLSGSQYIDSVNVMIALMPTVLFIGITNVIGMQMLVPLGKEKLVFYSVLAGGTIDFILNLSLIPIYGALGAAIATSIAEFVVLIVQIVWYPYDTLNIFKKIEVWKILISCGVAFITSYYVKGLSINIVIKVLSSGMIFFIVYYCILLVLREKLVFEISKKCFDKMKKSESR